MSQEIRMEKKRTLANVFHESASVERILKFNGPDNIRTDSRYKIKELGSDYVIISLLGDEELIIPFLAIVSLRIQGNVLNINYS